MKNFLSLMFKEPMTGHCQFEACVQEAQYKIQGLLLSKNYCLEHTLDAHSKGYYLERLEPASFKQAS